VAVLPPPIGAEWCCSRSREGFDVSVVAGETCGRTGQVSEVGSPRRERSPEGRSGTVDRVSREQSARPQLRRYERALAPMSARINIASNVPAIDLQPRTVGCH
jgi:hypothetical protein